MEISWLFSLALCLDRVTAQSSSEPTPTFSYSVQAPPSQWTPGQPYTTLGFAEEPVATLVTITTQVQAFPTTVVYVATGLPVAASASSSSTATTTTTTPSYHLPYLVRPHTVDGIPGYYYHPLLEEDVKRSTSYVINMTNVGSITCWYPISARIEGLSLAKLSVLTLE